MDGEADAIRDTVTDLDEFDSKGSDGNRLTSADLNEFATIQEGVLLQFFPNECQGQRCSVDRDREFSQQEGYRSDMVFMTMSNDQGSQLIAFGSEITEVRDDNVDPEHLFFGEHQAGIDEDGGVCILNDHHVQPDFTETAQRDHSEWG